MTGHLILVVGPSGVGKDTLLVGARAALAGDPAFVFARRDITRAAEAGGEEHRAISQSDFARTAAAGGYLLHWAAHGLSYGLPVALQTLREAGVHVIANGSRALLDEARARLGPVRIVSVTAPPDVLLGRLAVRGRETAADIAERLARATAHPVRGADVIEVVNDGPVEAGVAALVAAIKGQ